MPRVVQRRKVVSFIGHFGPPGLVWLAGAYLLYTASKLEGSASDRSFGMGLLLLICASMIFSARRSRQTTTRERALETQLQGLTKRVRAVESKVEGVILDVDTGNHAEALGQAIKRHSAQRWGKSWMHVAGKDKTGQG